MGIVPNGLLPNASAGVTRPLDPERWAVAEGRTEELIARIKPNAHSEGRRQAVYHYVQRLIMNCLACQAQVFTFGSVPLKTYLPDGDIDVTALSHNEELKVTWANLVRDALEREEKNENAEFRVKEVQYIQAEVKIIKCLVENIVVDISFNQVGGLCTLCFLEEADNLIKRNHLFKRSIILIKAWCFYESRILGAHHGLISTYALETLVLYIFHVFNNTFTGPLEVLFRFLEFFSNFDWEKFCLSLSGPVPISSLPDMTAEPPRMDSGELLLKKAFLESCSSIYGVMPRTQESQGQPFVSKHFNVIDPLRTNNNLGRSVNKGNFFRIRSAFAFGAKSLGKLLECPKENLIAELNQFFTNTWIRYESGNRPDVPIPSLRDVWPLKGVPAVVPNSHRGALAIKRKTEYPKLRTDEDNLFVDLEKPPMVDYSSRRNVLASEMSGTHSTKSLQDESMSSMNSSLHPSAKAPSDSNSVSSSYREDHDFVMNEELSSVSESSEMNHDEQVLVNLMASAKLHDLNGHVQLPMQVPSHLSVAHPPLLSPTVISQTHLAGIRPWLPNMQFLHGFIQPPMAHYIHDPAFTPNVEDGNESEKPVISDENHETGNNWHEYTVGFSGHFGSEGRDPHISNFDGKEHSSLPNGIPAVPLERQMGFTVDENGVGDENYTRMFPSLTGREASGSVSAPSYANSRSLSDKWGKRPAIAAPAQTTHSTNDGSVPQFERNEGTDQNPANIVGHKFSSHNEAHQPDTSATSTSSSGVMTEPPSDEHTPDILNSDILGHWNNLQYGRFCQNGPPMGPVLYPFPVPQMYLQGNAPWAGPGRPVAPHVNWTHMVGPGQRVLPVMPVQPTAERSTGTLQHYGEDATRYHRGTGTYFPNPKVPYRDRHSSSRNNRGGYSNDRSDYSDKEGGWIQSKHRNPNRSYGRSQSERSGMRSDRHATDDNQSDRQRRAYRNDSYRHESGTYRNDSYRHESGAQYLVQGQSFGTTNSMHKPANVTHGGYTPPSAASNGGGALSGPPGPPFFMVCSYEHGVSHAASSSEPIEFGSLGPLPTADGDDMPRPTRQVMPNGYYGQKRGPYTGGSSHSSPDQPSSPQPRR